MTFIKTAAATLVALALTVPSAYAEWGYDFDEEDNADWAWVNDDTGDAQLEIYCDDYEWWFTIYTGDTYDDAASYPSEVPTRVTIDGRSFKFVMYPNAMGEELVMELEYFDDVRVVDLGYVLETLDRPFTASFLDYNLTFTHEGAAEAVGAFLDLCG